MFANKYSKLGSGVTLLVDWLASMHDTQRVVAHVDNFRTWEVKARETEEPAHPSQHSFFYRFFFQKLYMPLRWSENVCRIRTIVWCRNHRSSIFSWQHRKRFINKEVWCVRIVIGKTMLTNTVRIRSIWCNEGERSAALDR